MIKQSLIVAALAGSTLFIPVAAFATQNHTDPCPGQHVQVYNEESFVEVAHFVCGPTQGVAGKDGAPGATGPAGPAGLDGAAGAAGSAGAAGEAGVAGHDGAQGAAGVDGKNGANGKNGVNGKPGTTTVVTKPVVSTPAPTTLPKTGATGLTWALGAAAAALLGAGTSCMVISRRRKAA